MFRQLAVTILRFMITWRTVEARALRPNKSAGARQVTRRHRSICVTTPNERPRGTGFRLLAKSCLLRNQPTSDKHPPQQHIRPLVVSTLGTVHKTTIRSI
uniref:Putative secreted protein n=1 Tax=Ixodes ricinus TaxID=34613 RepID=A0A147BDR9_IXORI